MTLSKVILFKSIKSFSLEVFELQFSVTLSIFKARLQDKFYFINVPYIMSSFSFTHITHAPFNNFSLL